MKTVHLAEKGLIPEFLIRFGIRQRLKRKLELEYKQFPASKEALIESLREGPVAIATDDANAQHYQVPTSFYLHALGPRMKYSACYWPEGVSNLQQAEEASLAQVAERAELQDGQRILELGCGWGSFSLWAAEHFPNARILAVSNSLTQAEHIRARARDRGFNNLEVQTHNMIHFAPEGQFDRIVSIEMLEHMRNYETLFAHFASWLVLGGKCFFHIFTHKELAYLYDDSDPDDWMSNYFFTGGIMPSHDLFRHFHKDLKIEKDWSLNGTHYTRTLEAWLDLIHANKPEVLGIFEAHYGKDAARWYHRWRMFVLACSELFAYAHGEEWGVSHYRMVKV